MSEKILVLDASPIINILGSGAHERIFTALSGACYVEERTLREVVRNPLDGSSAAPTIKSLVSEGLLVVGRMSDSTYERYLDLVAAISTEALGSGESAAITYANELGGMVVLDDRKARRVAKAKFRECEQCTSIGLFQLATERGGIPPNEVGSMIQSARTHARMHIWPEDRPWLHALGM